MKIVEALTPGAARALSKLGSRTPCGVCGFSLPKYPGRYPSKCPQCDTAIVATGIDSEDDDGSDAENDA